MSDDFSKMKGKPGAILFAAVFVVCFGGVGAFASWVVGATLLDAWQARSWTKVPAEVLQFDGGAVQYRYDFNERQFLGRRIGYAALDSDDRDMDTVNRIHKAVNDKTPLEVLVNPDDPSQSVVDAAIPWTMVVGFLPFAIGFGAVGLGALWVMVNLFIPESADDDEDEPIGSDAAGSFFGMALFTLLWNSLAFPIAGVMIVSMWGGGEWLVLLVLIFPLIGLLLIWATINAALNWIRRGGAQLHPQHRPPRLGSAFSGFVSFRRGVVAGDAYKAVLYSASKEEGAMTVTHWRGEQQGRVADVGGRRRLSIRFDPPDRLEGFKRDEETPWQLDLFPEGNPTAAFSFQFRMQPAAGVEHLPEEELEDDGLAPAMVGDSRPVAAGAKNRPLPLSILFGKGTLDERLQALPQEEREYAARHLASMTPEQRASFEKVAGYMPMVKKLVIAVVVLFFLVQMAGVVSMFFFSK